MLTLARRSPAQRSGTSTARSEDNTPPSILGPGVGIKGALEIDGELVVSGRVSGRIAAHRLIITVRGSVEGDVIAHEVVINGRMKGRVFAPTVMVEASADVEGRIFQTNVTVAQGARVVGRMPWRPISYFESLDKLPEDRP